MGYVEQSEEVPRLLRYIKALEKTVIELRKEIAALETCLLESEGYGKGYLDGFGDCERSKDQP